MRFSITTKHQKNKSDLFHNTGISIDFVLSTLHVLPSGHIWPSRKENIFVSMSAALYSAGTASSYRLGRPTPNNTNKIPTPININLQNVVCIAAGWQHNVIVYADGSVLGWGSNTDGQIGFSTKKNENLPTPVTTLSNVKVVWAACGDKITAYLTDTGDVYVANRKTHGPKKLPIPKCVYCACGINCAYAIADDGSLYQTKEEPLEDPYHFVFPRPIYDVAGGDNFTIAVTVDHVVYGKDKIVDNCHEFTVIPSLSEIKILRVFAYNQHSAVISLDGHVYTCGAGGSGRLGHGNEDSLDEFKLVNSLKERNIVDMDMGDSHTVFIDSEGFVYACGASDDGRLMLNETQPFKTPERSKYIKEHAVYTTCGCFHTYVLTGSTPIIHPGVKKFINYLTPQIPLNVLAGIDKVNIDIHALLQYGLLPGDIVRAGKNIGNVVGAVGTAKVALLCNNKLKTVNLSDTKFISRRGFIKVQVDYHWQALTLDGGDILKSYGLAFKEILQDKNENKFSVLGVFCNSLYLMRIDDPLDAIKNRSEGEQQQDNAEKKEAQTQTPTPHQEESQKTQENNKKTENKKESDSKADRIIPLDGSLSDIFSEYKLIETQRKIQMFTIDGVTYPCEILTPFFIHQNSPIQIVAKFAFKYVGLNSDGIYNFYKTETIASIENNGSFYAFDIVMYKGSRAVILSIGVNQAVINTENPEFRNNPAMIVSTSELELLARVIPSSEVTRTLNNIELKISPLFGENEQNNPAAKCCPGDIYVNEKGYILVVGFSTQDKTPYGSYVKGNGEIFPFKPDECKLLRRIYNVGNHNVIYNADEIPVVLSALESSMAGTGLLHGDEVIVDNEINAVVCGAKDHYLWLMSFNRELFCIYMNDRKYNNRIQFVERLSSHYQCFL